MSDFFGGFSKFVTMLKRCLHVLLVGWLINVLICFHPAFGAESRIPPRHSASSAHHSDNTFLDILLHHLVSYSSSHKKGLHGRISTRSRYTSAQAVSLSVVLPQTIIFNLVGQAQQLFCEQLKFWETKVFLPPLHHFLFRLSPF